MKHKEISIIILTYNASWEKLKSTIDSALAQNNIDMEIIVADDGSENSLQDCVERYLLSKDLSKFDYQLITNAVNQGTVKNAISGLSVAKGKYSKLISPGDKLLQSDTLRNWLDALEGSEWSFSDALYFDEKGKQLSIMAQPQNIQVYLNHDAKAGRWHYVVLRDIALGASIIGLTTVQLEYCKRLRDAGVIYAEDNMWRLLMFEGHLGQYYPKATVYYECGSGISTNNNQKWHQKLKEDWEITDSLMVPAENDRFQRKMIKEMHICGFRKIFIKGKIKLILKRIFFRRLSESKGDNT